MRPKYNQEHKIPQEVFDKAYDKLDDKSKIHITRNTTRLSMTLRHVGEKGAQELLARIGMHLITGEADLRKLPYLLHEE